MNITYEDNTNDLLRRIYDKKYKKWFKLNDIPKLKNMSYKSAKALVGPIYTKYEAQGLIKKKGRRYYIHYLLLDKFSLKRPRAGTTVYDHPWKTNLCWTTVDNYEEQYHLQLFRDLKELTPGVNYYGCVEQDDSGRNHVHMLADTEPEKLRPFAVQVLRKYLDDERFFRLYCEEVFNKGGCVDYLLKNPQKLIY